jgi:hypothetical protein
MSGEQFQGAVVSMLPNSVFFQYTGSELLSILFSMALWGKDPMSTVTILFMCVHRDYVYANVCFILFSGLNAPLSLNDSTVSCTSSSAPISY